MKKYNTLFVVLFTILFAALLTWILPITYLNGEFITAERAQVGITELFSYPVYTFYNFIYVLAYLLIKVNIFKSIIFFIYIIFLFHKCSFRFSPFNAPFGTICPKGKTACLSPFTGNTSPYIPRTEND